MIPNKQRKNYSQDLKDAIEEFARRKDKPHVIEEFFCGSDRQSLTVDLLHIVPLPLLSSFYPFFPNFPDFQKLIPKERMEGKEGKELLGRDIQGVTRQMLENQVLED